MGLVEDTSGDLLVSSGVILFQHRRTVVLVAVVAALGAIAITQVMPRTFLSGAAFVPEVGNPGSLSMLANVSAAAGLNIATPDPSQSPAFYGELLKSAPVRRAVLGMTVDTASEGSDAPKNVTLLDFLVPGTDRIELRMEEGIRTLESMTEVTVDRSTGIVRVQVLATRARVSADIANEYVAQLDKFNREARLTQARARRQFTEVRVAEAEAALADAEARLLRFTQENRAVQVPTLRFEEARLQRQVDLRQELYKSLRRELELSRIAEADETPLITSVERAIEPMRKAGPNRTRIVLGSFVAGASVSASWLLFAAFYRSRLIAFLALAKKRITVSS